MANKYKITADELKERIELDNPEYETDWIVIDLFDNPEAAARPRFSKKTGRAYTTKTNREYKLDLLAAFSDALPELIDNPILGEVKIHIKIFISKPKYISAYDNISELADNGFIRPAVKPDFDNYAKIICDVLNKGFIADDGQIVSAIIEKFYANTPRLEVKLEFRQFPMIKKS